MCKIIVVANSKGGVGKTTISVNLASSLAVLEKRTLLIDMDPAAACAVSLGFQKDDLKGDVFSLLGFSKSLQKSIHNDLQPLASSTTGKIRASPYGVSYRMAQVN